MVASTQVRMRPVPVLPRTSRLKAHGLRDWLGLSQEAFARAVGISRSTVARWEAHSTGPDPNTAEGRILAMMDEIRQRATRIWGKQEGRRWLHDNVVALQAKPIEVLITRGPAPVYQVLMELWEGTY